MKCPTCADTEKQWRLGPTDGQPDHTSYRCDACGRLYSAAVPDLASVFDRLELLKARVEALSQEHARMIETMAIIEEQILATQLLLRGRRDGGK